MGDDGGWSGPCGLLMISRHAESVVFLIREVHTMTINQTSITPWVAISWDPKDEQIGWVPTKSWIKEEECHPFMRTSPISEWLISEWLPSSLLLSLPNVQPICSHRAHISAWKRNHVYVQCPSTCVMSSLYVACCLWLHRSTKDLWSRIVSGLKVRPGATGLTDGPVTSSISFLIWYCWHVCILSPKILRQTLTEPSLVYLHCSSSPTNRLLNHTPPSWSELITQTKKKN